MTLSLYAMAMSLMCCPLYGIQVDAVLVHFPERRELAQLLHLLADEAGGVVHFLLRGEAAERDADRAVSELVVAPQRAQHVRGLERRRSAGRARGNGDVLHRHDERLALDE